MDDVDRKLLAQLQVDATMAVAELADQVRPSATRFGRKFKADGAGDGRYRADCFAAIEAHEHTADWLGTFAATVTEKPEVMNAYRRAGEVDDMLRVAVVDLAAFDDFYKRLTKTVPLKNVTSRVPIERLKIRQPTRFQPRPFVIACNLTKDFTPYTVSGLSRLAIQPRASAQLKGKINAVGHTSFGARSSARPVR
ncbi:MAG: Lrp/AsnC family transcriptional regulator [Janthinobacterium lividum]